jgi:restriction endonuclease Mrr
VPIFDNLSGYEFEEIMADAYRNADYKKVHVSRKSGDEGRDIIMEEVVNGERRGVVVECKHQQRVGRPVIQKLHSAITTHDFEGPKRGILVTTGTVSKEARKYAQKIRDQGDGTLIEIIDGSELRERADGAGLNLHNGRVEIICDQTFPPIDSSGDVDTPVREAFESIDNFNPENISDVNSSVAFDPVVYVGAMTKATFETSAGIIHRIYEGDLLLLRADRRRPALTDDSVRELAVNPSSSKISIDELQTEESFDISVAPPFKNTRIEYMNWTTEYLQQKYSSTVKYTGDNDVTYKKECVPDESDITVNYVSPVYVPKVSSQTTIQDNAYTLSYYAVGSSRKIIYDDIRRCTHCDGDKWWANSFTYCDNCGSISCRKHIKTERLENKPICSDCAVAERFALRKKYFYTKENREQFREIYEQMSLQQKALENKPVLVSVALVIVSIVLLVI